MMPLISILMTSYNYAHFIGEAIESVVAQTYTKWELIIVDDASTDESRNVIGRYQDKRIRPLFLSKNVGGSAAYNKALALAQGEFIASLDSDDLFEPSKLERQLAVFAERPEIDICGTFIREIGGDGLNAHEDAPGMQWFNVPLDLNDPTAWVWQNRLCHSSVVIRKAIHDRIGKWDERLRYALDWDFWIKALASGARFHVIPEPLTIYRIHGKNLTYQAPERLIEEFAEISATFFHPYLLKINREDLLLNNLMLFVDNSTLRERGKDYYGRMMNTLLLRIESENSPVGALLYNIACREREILAAKDWLAEQLSNCQQNGWYRFGVLFKKGKLIFFIRKEVIKIYEIFCDSCLEKAADSIISFARKASRFMPVKLKVQLRNIYEKCLPRIVRLREKTIFYRQLPHDPPLVSVVIPCFNYGHYVEEAIDSVLAQTFQNFEIIVIDGGSTDEPTLIKLHSINKPKTTVYFRESRHLVGDNRNYGIQLARGKYICCLDADDRLLPTYLEKALFLGEVYNYDIVHPAVQCFEGSDILWEASRVSLPMLSKGNFIATVAVFKKELWEKIGGYKDFGLGENHVPEDWEFWVRAVGHGYRAMPIKEVLMLYRVHKSGLTASCKRSLAEQSRVIIAANKELFEKDNLRKINKLAYVHYVVKDLFINLTSSSKTKKKILFAGPFGIPACTVYIFKRYYNHYSKGKKIK